MVDYLENLNKPRNWFREVGSKKVQPKGTVVMSKKLDCTLHPAFLCLLIRPIMCRY
jgi:hypothetical protein